MALACSLKGSSENPSILIWLAKSLLLLERALSSRELIRINSRISF